MARTTTKPTEPPAEILNQPLAQALSERYLSYALSTIMARSLPDVRDGLKPVHRRLMFAMRELKLDPNLPPKKSARVVGDVIGKFHPMATPPCMTRWCAWRRISHNAIRSLKGKAISGISMVITPPRCVIPKRG